MLYVIEYKLLIQYINQLHYSWITYFKFGNNIITIDLYVFMYI